MSSGSSPRPAAGRLPPTMMPGHRAEPAEGAPCALLHARGRALQQVGELARARLALAAAHSAATRDGVDAALRIVADLQAPSSSPW